MNSLRTDPKARAPIRVMVVDDSATSRRAIAEMLSHEPDLVVVGRASDGEEALREATQLKPDVICLDLEMPRMDGFTFLRLLMAKQPTPVIVISSYARKTDVFRALELGALDFIAKPDKAASGQLDEIRAELTQKVRTVRQLRMANLEWRAQHSDEIPSPAAPDPRAAPLRLCVIGASTGGPPALMRIMAALPGDLPLAVAIAQHMPERFTRAFAERLGRITAYQVTEAEDGDALAAGRAVVAPGGKNLAVERDLAGNLKVVVKERSASGKFCPSIDLLFESAARALGHRVCGVVLTGMGNDGRAGVKAIHAAGGHLVAESEKTAVVFGMPKEAIDTGAVHAVLPVEEIAMEVRRFASSGAREAKGRR